MIVGVGLVQKVASRGEPTYVLIWVALASFVGWIRAQWVAWRDGRPQRAA